jgi:hypothetical protein
VLTVSDVYFYVVDRDFGFAPNPFHGVCTLATCKPVLRRVAKPDDWILGMGGSRLKAVGKCIFAMKVSKKITFNEYWNDPNYRDKKPVRNGSLKMVVGDNIYWKQDEFWNQSDSHHSNPDGSPNPHNLKNDTQTDAVLISHHFYYFGSSAVLVGAGILSAVGYKNGRHHRVFSLAAAQPVISLIERSGKLNQVAADPYDFDVADARYSVHRNRIVKAADL